MTITLLQQSGQLAVLLVDIQSRARHHNATMAGTHQNRSSYHNQKCRELEIPVDSGFELRCLDTLRVCSGPQQTRYFASILALAETSSKSVCEWVSKRLCLFVPCGLHDAVGVESKGSGYKRFIIPAAGVEDRVIRKVVTCVDNIVGQW